MLFIEWEPVIRWAVAALVLGLCVFAFFSVRKRRALIRRPVRGLVAAVFIADFICICVFVSLVSETSYSTAVFSPDRSMAARIVYTDYRGERDVDVQVFRRRGFSNETVYEARPLLTEKDIHWLDDKNLWLAGLDPFFCVSTDFVAIHCGAANSPAASHEPILVRLMRLINAPAAQAPSLRPGPPSESRSAR
jgi:hypothetical protein